MHEEHPKSPFDSLCTSRKLVMPDEINPNGNLFGGILMSWMDKLAFMSAQKHSGQTKVVTVNIDQIQFKQSIEMGDHVVLVSQVDYVGITSMEIGVQVERECPRTSRREYVASAVLTFVALGDHNRPIRVPRLVPASHQDVLRYAAARVRVKIRGRIRIWFEERFPDSVYLKEAQEPRLDGNSHL